MNPRRQRFADLVLQGRPASRAYREAGFSPKTDRVAEVEASKLMRIPEIMAYIEERKSAAAALAEINLAEVLRDLHAIGTDPAMPAQARVNALSEIARRIPAGDGAVPVEIPLHRPLTGDDEQDASIVAMAALKAVVAGALPPAIGRIIALQASAVMDVTGLARLLLEAAPAPPPALTGPAVESRPLSHPKRPVWRKEGD